MTSPDHSAITRFEGEKYRAASSLDHSDAKSAFIGRGQRNRRLMRSSRQLSQYPLYETRRFSDFIKAHGDPRCDVALGADDLLGCEGTVWVTRQGAAQVKCLAARTPRKARQTQLRRQDRCHDAGADESVAQSRVFVIDGTERLDLVHHRLDGVDQ